MTRVYPNGAVAHGSLEGFGGSPFSIRELRFPPNDRISDIFPLLKDVVRQSNPRLSVVLAPLGAGIDVRLIADGCENLEWDAAVIHGFESGREVWQEGVGWAMVSRAVWRRTWSVGVIEDGRSKLVSGYCLCFLGWS